MSGNISDFGTTPDPNISVGGPTQVPPSQEVGEESGLTSSTIKKSELEALLIALIAGIPLLSPPGTVATSFNDDVIRQLSLQTEQKKHDIISSMWDTYLGNVRELAERFKEEDIRRETVDATKAGPKSSVEYYTYLMTVSANRRAEEIEGESSLVAQFSSTFNNWLVNPIGASNSMNVEGVASKGYPDASFVAGCLACSAAILTAIGKDSALLGIQLSTSPVVDALAGVGPATGLPVDYQAAAALVAALLNNGAMYKAATETIEKAAKSTQPPQDLDFALNYAKNIIAIVTQNVEKGQPMSPERAGQNNMIRLMLAAMALNMVFRAGYGGMAGEDLASILAGNTKDIPEQIRATVEQLAGLIRGFLPKEAGPRADVISRLMDYIDSKDPVDSMLQTTGLFKSLLDTGGLDSERIAAGKG